MTTQTDLNLAQTYIQERSNSKITPPDFKTWAENIVTWAQHTGNAHSEIERALEQSYSQGYSIGLNNGWAIEQDKEIEAVSSHRSALRQTVKNLKEAFPNGFYQGELCSCSECKGDVK